MPIVDRGAERRWRVGGEERSGGKGEEEEDVG
jgi:hypothetical protein